MDELVPLQIPEQRQLAIDPNALFPAADGFNYPTLRLLNKQARISISQSLALNHGVQYQALSVANTCGWFAAIRTSDIILSPLEDLRTRISAAKAEDKSLFVPKRTLTIVLGKPCIIAFGARDSMLFVGLEEGHVLTYDTATLFSESKYRQTLEQSKTWLTFAPSYLQTTRFAYSTLSWSPRGVG
ncbi:hypothetical protein BDN72DRAFT_273427 [Pluteus cervinus]|uniref:Uncharacterized protein n=1 Tax=Pluteus cervinus TaxID=181527 RepID=A0ACD3B5R9_9AGAR|nr:hypothetical protein BDN72DRAFT_273427 [Pluteus cervinus]